MPEQQIVDQRVGGQRQMMAVLLDGRSGQHQQRRFARQRVHLLPGEIGKVACVGNPGLHRAHRLFAKADHLAGIQQARGIVLLLGQQLNVVGAKAAAVFKIVHVRVGDKDADLAAEGDHVVQSLLGGEAHHRNRAGNHDAVAVLHELDVEQNFVAEALAQQAELFSQFVGENPHCR